MIHRDHAVCESDYLLKNCIIHELDVVGFSLSQTQHVGSSSEAQHYSWAKIMLHVRRVISLLNRRCGLLTFADPAYRNRLSTFIHDIWTCLFGLVYILSTFKASGVHSFTCFSPLCLFFFWSNFKLKAQHKLMHLKSSYLGVTTSLGHPILVTPSHY